MNSVRRVFQLFKIGFECLQHVLMTDENTIDQPHHLNTAGEAAIKS